MRNFRCFGTENNGEWGFTFSPNAHLSLIIGPNGSGKTALLDAIDLTLNSEGRSNRSLVTEFDFPNCDTAKSLSIEVVLTDLGHAIGAFESDIQWIDPADGVPVEEKNTEVDANLHRKAVIIRFEAVLDAHTGEIEWRWLLPKFHETEMMPAKELSSTQHKSLGYFRINPATTAGAFSLGQYSVLGRHLRKLNYRLGKLPESLRGRITLPTCSIENHDCGTCDSRSDCVPASEDVKKSKTIAGVLAQIISVAKNVLGSEGWSGMQAGLGPRYGGLTSALAGITIGLRANENKDAFIPFDRLSSGEKYALSFALAKNQVPGELPPVIVVEEPETALYPSAVVALLREVQSVPTGVAPQVIVTSHSESVLRCFSPQDIIILGLNRTSVKFQEVLENVNPGARTPFYKPEYRVMSSSPNALFADKVLVVEGVGDSIAIGHLDRIAAKNTATAAHKHTSFSVHGWCVFQTNGASEIHDSVRVLQALGKRVAALFDGDDPGRSHASATMNLCPTFIYTSKTLHDPMFEDVLLAGLPTDKRHNVLLSLQDHQECSSCERLRQTKRGCWTQSGKCPKGDRSDRKNMIRYLCLNSYEENGLFPPVFERLLGQIEHSVPHKLHALDLD